MNFLDNKFDRKCPQFSVKINFNAYIPPIFWSHYLFRHFITVMFTGQIRSSFFGHPLRLISHNHFCSKFKSFLFFQFRAKESTELETIPEDLEIPLTLASPQHRINIEVTNVTIDQVKSSVTL